MATLRMKVGDLLSRSLLANRHVSNAYGLIKTSMLQIAGASKPYGKVRPDLEL